MDADEHRGELASIHGGLFGLRLAALGPSVVSVMVHWRDAKALSARPVGS